MSIFFSGWLPSMVERAGDIPPSKIQSLFQILQDWADVPCVRQHLQNVLSDETGQRELKAYVVQLIQFTGVANPDMVGGQLHLMLLGAFGEVMRQPDTYPIEHAWKASLLLVNAQMPPR